MWTANNMTNSSLLINLGNGTGAVADDDEVARLFARYGWAAGVMSITALCGFLLNMTELYAIGRTPALRNNNTPMLLIAGTCARAGFGGRRPVNKTTARLPLHTHY